MKCLKKSSSDLPASGTITLHTALYPVDQLVGLAAVQQGSDSWQRVQDDGLRVGIDVVLKHRH